MIVLPYAFLYNKNFYIIIAVVTFVLLGGGFLSYQIDYSANKKTSSIFFDALSKEEKKEERLLSLVDKKKQPYADIANMHLAALYHDIGGDNSKEKVEKIYSSVALNSEVLPIKELASLYSYLLTNNPFADIKIYGMTFKFFKAAKDIEEGELKNAKETLENIIASLDANDYLKDLSKKLLRSCA